MLKGRYFKLVLSSVFVPGFRRIYPLITLTDIKQRVTTSVCVNGDETKPTLLIVRCILIFLYYQPNNVMSLTLWIDITNIRIDRNVVCNSIVQL